MEEIEQMTEGAGKVSGELQSKVDMLTKKCGEEVEVARIRIESARRAELRKKDPTELNTNIPEEKKELFTQLKAFCVSEMTDGIAAGKKGTYCDCWAGKLVEEFTAQERKQLIQGDPNTFTQVFINKVNKLMGDCEKAIK